ncbi:(E3-independent) E2 ubiquitin-conjugating enzyme [Xyrauchen texanus]|uniref:(E3-independent) E2 ubiquitin-conjugating enzyme n=1 Tax=Xyrauchen texanus TaxID=154827 RepID=UPI002242A11A|nr:(E3-independent) E2 ubiquitin-conjugating enzyme [Xyrauchen texanus]
MAEHITAALSPAVSPSSEPPSGALTPTEGGTQRLLFTHDLVSGKHGGAMRFGLVRMIHGEEDFEDSDSEIGGGRGGGGGGCGGGGGGGDGGGARSNSDNESGAADTRSWPLGRGFVRVQWYPEGTKQDVRETK